MELRKTASDLLKVVFPLLLGGTILWWMYRGQDFGSIKHVLLHEMDWTWMLLSLPFGVLAQAFRGWRWRQTLKPVGESPRRQSCVHAVFVSYAVSLVVPRIGEFVRCGLLKRHEGTSFAKALGTVVTERAVDMVVVALVASATLVAQLPVFSRFFSQTGTRLDVAFVQFSPTGWVVTSVCGVAALVLMASLLRRMTIYNKVKEAALGIWQGIVSLRHVDNIARFVVLTLGIWTSYFLHYYLTFFCFPATSGLGPMCGLVTFVVGSIAVIVPTPNGAGPWHFAVKTMLILYGVADEHALWFVLIVHTLQTGLVILLGVYGWVRMAFQPLDLQQPKQNNKY